MINPPLIFTMIKRKKMPKKRKYSQADALRDAQKNYGGAFGKSVMVSGCIRIWRIKCQKNTKDAKEKEEENIVGTFGESLKIK